jgi:hypothetical protein
MNTLEKVNIAILLATITYIIAINSLLSGTEQIGPGLRWFITFLTSVGLFRLAHHPDLLGDPELRHAAWRLPPGAVPQGSLDLPLRGRRGPAHGHLAHLAGSSRRSRSPATALTPRAGSTAISAASASCSNIRASTRSCSPAPTRRPATSISRRRRSTSTRSAARTGGPARPSCGPSRCSTATKRTASAMPTSSCGGRRAYLLRP